MTDSEQPELSGGSTTVEEQTQPHTGFAENSQIPAVGVSSLARKRKREPPLALAGLGLVLVAVFVALVVSTQNRSKSSTDSDDLGAGVSNAAGLRGHLITRWQGRAQYQLKIEPIDARADAGFARAAADPPEPLYINIRLLDASGFALCGKQILLPFANMTPPAVTPGQDRARASDMFQTIASRDGKIEALWAQGELPCSPDQYKRFDYWDLSTNFPTLPEQAELLTRKPGTNKLTVAEAHATAARKAAKRVLSAFYIEGDDRVGSFEASRGLLLVGTNRGFYIDKKDQGTAVAWAADAALIHFKCDQRGICGLKRAGSTAIVLAKMNE